MQDYISTPVEKKERMERMWDNGMDIEFGGVKYFYDA